MHGKNLTLQSLVTQLEPFLLHHWWLPALVLGFLLLFGGKKARKKKKSGDAGGVLMLMIILGGMLFFAGGTGTVLKTVVPAFAHTGGNRAIGQRLAAGYGWTGSQWGCLDQLWTHESGWKSGVWNYQGSGAYGIPQSLPASKMSSAGADYMTNPATQIRWGLGYIRSTYGNPCNAWSAWQSRSPHWY